MLGYRVKETKGNRFATALNGLRIFELEGKRVTYTLVEMQKNPGYFFALNSKNNICRIKGYKYFRIENNKIQPYG